MEKIGEEGGYLLWLSPKSVLQCTLSNKLCGIGHMTTKSGEGGDVKFILFMWPYLNAVLQFRCYYSSDVPFLKTHQLWDVAG